MKYLILGASAAGINAAKTIRSLDKTGEICMVSEDEKIYSRCMLHMFINGHRDMNKINFSNEDFFKENNIEWIRGKRVIALNSINKNVQLEDGTIIEYDKLLIATGASSFIPPIKGINLASGVYGLRNAEDAEAIKEMSQKVKSAVVIGAGLVGIDAVAGLLEKGIKIHLIEMADRILPMQLDSKAAKKYEEAFMKKGVVIYLKHSVKEVLVNKNGSVSGVLLNNEEKLECQMIIVAAGVKPNVDFIKDTSVMVGRGVVINEKCETTEKNIYAAGDVTYMAPVWPVAVKQGITAGYNMAGFDKKLNQVYAAQNSMNFLGINTVSTGFIYPPDDTYQVEIQDATDSYKKIIHKDGIICGAIIQGDIAYCGALFNIIKSKLEISQINKSIFDINFADFFGIKDDGQFEYIPL